MWVDHVTAGWDQEYQYRSLFHLTHEEYLDEDPEAIAWLLHVHQVREQVQADKEKRAAG